MTLPLKSIFFFGAIFLSICSCKTLTEIHPASPSALANNPNYEPNSWIYDQMKYYYLWTDNMAEKSKTNFKLNPDIYFDSLLVQPGVLDRFSWIQSSATDLSNTLNGVNKVLGIKTTAFYADTTKTKVFLAIALVLKNSAAELAGIKRGDVIMQVNGSDLSNSNYATALQNENLNLTLGKYSNGILSNTNNISVTKTVLQTDPILKDTIILKGNKKIGYLVYLQFLTQYDQALRNVFANFKNQGIDELILDLRFNGGGYISSSNILSSLIVKNLNPNELMNRQEWNATQTALYSSSSFNQNWLNEPNNLKTLSRVYILTSNGTASASELIINNLKPKMQVILVGDHTYGKNVGSISISDNQNRWAWGMQPIVLKTYNMLNQSDYGTTNGFLPDVAVKDNQIPYMPLGDEHEVLFSAALNHILGNTTARMNNKNFKTMNWVGLKEPILDNPKNEIRDMFIK